jgi:CheY-like chemotaxis protein
MSNSDQTNNHLCFIGEADPFLARLLQRFAEKCGLQVQLARTGDELLELAQRDQPAVIILEPELPGNVRGWEIVQELRKGDPARNTPMIICSWLNKPEAMALVGQGSAYLQKPDLHYEDFVAALKVAGIKLLWR